MGTTKQTESQSASQKALNTSDIDPSEFELPIRDDRLLLPQKCCALVFSVTPQAIQQWPVKWRKKVGRTALYYLPDLALYREFTNSKLVDLDLQRERARLAAAQADRTELEVKQLRRELIPESEIAAQWDSIVVAIRSKVLGIPSKLKTIIPKLTDKDLAKVRKTVRGVLEDLANSGGK